MSDAPPPTDTDAAADPSTDTDAAADPSTDTDAAADPSTDTEDPPESRRMRRALTHIRREGWKIAAVYAIVDAALATLAVNLALTLLGVPYWPERLRLTEAVLAALRATAGVTPADPTVSTAAVAGVLVGCVVFVAELAWRVRRPLVEQFEAANPSLRESLRTARDAVTAGQDTAIARRLYEDVLADLREASSIGLLDLRRVAGTLVVVSLLSVATIHLAVVDLSVAGVGGPPGDDAPDGGTRSEYAGLQDSSSILGEPENVPSGEETLNTTVDTSGAGSGEGSAVDAAAAYDRSGFADSTTVQSQRAGFDETDRVEDADLIREYNLRIRQEDDS